MLNDERKEMILKALYHFVEKEVSSSYETIRDEDFYFVTLALLNLLKRSK